MESTETFTAKIATLEKALNTFRLLMAQDTSGLDAILKDGIKNGCIQKFEYSIELTWKLAKYHSEHIVLQPCTYPKDAIRYLYLANKISDTCYEGLLDAIMDRNKLSHIYKEDFFNQIIEKLPLHLNVMQEVLEVMKNEVE